MDEPGWFHFVVLEATGDPATPTPAEVVAETGAGGAVPAAVGSIAVGVANAVQASTVTSGLEREKTYAV